MPIFDYILLAVLGAGGTTVTAPPLRTIDADTVRQPNGGAISEFRSVNQPGQKKSRINFGTVTGEKGPEKKRRHRRRHRHPKPDSFTVKQK